MVVMGRYEHEVMNAVGLRGTVSVRDLAALLDVSAQTVRRVVKPMVQRGEVHKVHGAITSVTSTGDAPFLTRMNVARDAKVAIAARVAQLVRDGDSVALTFETKTELLTMPPFGLLASEVAAFACLAVAAAAVIRLARRGRDDDASPDPSR